MANEFSRNISDAKLTTVKVLPAENATNIHDPIDLGAGIHQGERMELDIGWPAMSQLANGLSITFVVQDSPDTTPGNFADVMAGVLSPPGAGGVGIPAGSRRLRLPSNVRRYIQVKQTLPLASGIGTLYSTTVRCVF